MSRLLVVIDMQKGFDCPEAKKVVKKINQTSKLFDNICFAMFENKKESLFETQLKWIDFQNDEDKSLMEGIKASENAHYIWHSTYTVYNDELKKFIKELQPTEVYISGLFSDVCLLKTAMDMFDDNILPRVVKDLSASPHGDGAHDVAFDTMKIAIGEEQIVLTKEIANV